MGWEDDAAKEDGGIRVFTLVKRALFISTCKWAPKVARPKVNFWIFTVQIAQRS
jgi:hypothetical protein